MPKKLLVPSVSVEVAVCVFVPEKYASCPVVPEMEDAPPRHVLFTEKQPPVRLNPTLEVEVAKPLMVRPLKVVVPNPVEEIENGTVLVSINASDVVPILKSPPVLCVNQCFRFVPPEVSVSVNFAAAAATFSLPSGVVVPMPMLPPVERNRVEVAEREVEAVLSV